MPIGYITAAVWTVCNNLERGSKSAVAHNVPFGLGMADKRTFEWGAKLARIWVSKSTALPRKSLFAGFGMVAIFLNIEKKKLHTCACQRKRPFLHTLGGQNGPPIAQYIHVCLRRLCIGRKKKPYLREISAKIMRIFEYVCTCSPGCGVLWCGVVWCGVVWCGVVWCAEGAVTKRQRPGCLPTGKGKRAGLCVLCARCV